MLLRHASGYFISTVVQLLASVLLLALLTRRLGNDEVKIVAHELMQRDEFDKVDIGVLISKLTDELPSQVDIERVRTRLATKGWPLDEAHDDGDHA